MSVSVNWVVLGARLGRNLCKRSLPVVWFGDCRNCCSLSHHHSKNGLINDRNRLSSFYRPFPPPFTFCDQVRFLSITPVRWDKDEPVSKAERTLNILKEEIRHQQLREKPSLLISKPADSDVQVEKKGLWQRVKDEFSHYYHGFRLLFLEIRVSSKYIGCILTGKRLSRREKKQLIRTMSDVFRLVPFSVFIIVPFMEFLLPVALWLFPNMLPSTFQQMSKEEEKIRLNLKLRLEMAKFLQATLEEISLNREKRGEETDTSMSQEFTHFMRRIRSEGGYISNADLLKYTKLFEDELTLENLSISQLRALCRLVNIKPLGLGTPNILRFQLNLKLRELKADDQQIDADGGVNSLSVNELQQANRARGMRALGLSEERLKSQLRAWLELSLNDKVPPSLLLLSRTLYFPEDVNITDRLKTIVQTLPESIAEETRLKLTEVEGHKADYKAKLELIRSIEDALKRERIAEAEAKVMAHEKLAQQMAEEAALELEAKLAAERAPLPLGTDPIHKMIAEKGLAPPPPEPEPVIVTKKEKAIEHEELEQIEDALHDVGGEFHEEKEDLEDLKEAIQEHREDIEEVKEIVMARGESVSETKASTRLQDKVDDMISHVDTLLDKLHDEGQQLSEQLKFGKEEGTEDQQRLVSINELVERLRRLKKIEDNTKIQRIHEVLQTLDDNHDGSIDVNLALEAIELLGQEENVKITRDQMSKLIEMLKKEEKLHEARQSH